MHNIISGVFFRTFVVMLNPSKKQVLQAYEAKNYRFFGYGYYNLNIFGIRSNTSRSNHFDDLIGVVFYDQDKTQQLLLFPATTDPGKYYLKNPLTPSGTAILVPGQHLGAYTLGIHGRTWGGYTALEQVKSMPYVRDKNRDEVIDFDLYRDKKNIFHANLKTNLHRASKYSIVRLIERYSAGCQVIQNPKDFDTLIALCKKQIEKGHGNAFTYTLFEQHEIWEI